MELFKLFATIAIRNKDANDALDETGNKAEGTKGKLANAFSKMGSFAVKFGKIAGAGITAGATAIVGITKKAVDAYADYEQLVGGVETLFGKSAKIVQNYADNAYKTAGMSANEYMETVTGFSASLLQSLNGNTEKAAKKANTAITDMSDNANKMGSSMESIQNAYQGFAKQNYTMLDNLKLGYGGTKEEMQRLLQDAQKISGQKFDLSSYADIVDAIHVVQTKMGITGTTAKEAATTIQGSMSMAKSAWQNLLVGIADDTQNFDVLMNNFVSSVMTVGKNLIPRIFTIVQGIGSLITGFAEKLFPKIAEKLPSLIKGLLPNILTSAQALFEAVLQILPSLVGTVVQIIPQLVTGILELIPQLMDVGMEIVLALLDGITQMLPNILVTIVSVIPQLIDKLVSFVPELLNAAIQLLMVIVDAIPEVIDALSDNLSDLIKTIIYGLIDAIPDLLAGAIELLNAIVQALPVIIETIGEQLPWLIETIIQGFVDLMPELQRGGYQFFTAIIEAIPLLLDALIPQLPIIVSTVVSQLVSMLPILIQGAVKLFMGLVTGISRIIPALISALPSIINAIITYLTMPVNGLFKGMWEGIKTIFSPVVGWFSEKFNSVKAKITEPIEKAKNTIKNIVDKIKGFFSGANLSFPHIKLPHFSVSPNGWKIGDLLKGSIPKLGIDWYAKAMDDGMIMNKPTIFGVNANGQPMGGGEAGSETVVGTNNLMTMIQTAVNNANAGNSKLLEMILAELRLMNSSFADKLSAELQKIGIKWDEREIARLIRKYA